MALRAHDRLQRRECSDFIGRELQPMFHRLVTDREDRDRQLRSRNARSQLIEEAADGVIAGQSPVDLAYGGNRADDSQAKIRGGRHERSQRNGGKWEMRRRADQWWRCNKAT